MTTIDKDGAVEIAKKRVNELAEQAADQFELVLELTKEVDLGWVFFFNSSEFVRTGDFSSQLAGNGPILVLRTGEIRQLPSSLPWEMSLNKFK